MAPNDTSRSIYFFQTIEIYNSAKMQILQTSSQISLVQLFTSHSFCSSPPLSSYFTLILEPNQLFNLFNIYEHTHLLQFTLSFNLAQFNLFDLISLFQFIHFSKKLKLTRNSGIRFQHGFSSAMHPVMNVDFFLKNQSSTRNDEYCLINASGDRQPSTVS